MARGVPQDVQQVLGARVTFPGAVQNCTDRVGFSKFVGMHACMQHTETPLSNVMLVKQHAFACHFVVCHAFVLHLLHDVIFTIWTKMHLAYLEASVFLLKQLIPQSV